MKKLLALILALVMSLSLVACGAKKEEAPAAKPAEGAAAPAETPAEPTKLNLILRAGTYADVIKECLPAFEEANNVICEVQELSEADL